MSFLERAKQAASQTAAAAQGVAQRATSTLSDPATAEKARQTLTRAKKGFATAIDRIDPSVLADVIIKATALQEKANAALRAKGSVYRINQIGIGASIPPSVTFTITRLDGLDEAAGAVDSTDLLHAVTHDAHGTIQALDGTTLDEAIISEEDA